MIFLGFVVIGKLSYRRRVQDIAGKGDQRAWGEIARIEEREVGEMVEGQNAYRRRRGAPEVSEEQVRHRVGEEQLDRLRDAERGG